MGADLIPAKFDEQFIEWFRAKTEAAWANYEPRDFLKEPVGGVDWQKGTRWSKGLSEAEIAAAEAKWNLKFPPDYRLFLKHLHVVDRPMKGAFFTTGTVKAPGERPAFYDWTNDSQELRAAFEWPLEGLFFELEHNALWSPAWDKKPTSLESQQKKVRELVESAPPLIPLFSHRYLPAAPCEAGNPVLSVYQSDVIVYGSDFRGWLLEEFAELLALDAEAIEANQSPLVSGSVESIPFWGDLVR